MHWTDSAGGEENAGDEEWMSEVGLITVVKGLPSTVVVGTQVAFTLRLTNGTGMTKDEVLPFAYVHATDKTGLKSVDELVHQWSSGSSSTWKTVDNKHYMDAISSLKAGAHTDIKMRLKIDNASAPAGDGITFIAGDYFNDDGSCGGSPDLEGYEFVIGAAGSKPGKTGDATTSTTAANVAPAARTPRMPSLGARLRSSPWAAASPRSGPPRPAAARARERRGRGGRCGRARTRKSSQGRRVARLSHRATVRPPGPRPVPQVPASGTWGIFVRAYADHHVPLPSPPPEDFP